jgi:hypothetical protein
MKNRFLVVLTVVLLFVLTGISSVFAQEVVPITIRCKADVQGGEGWRCDNFAEVEEEVEADLGIDLELTLIQDNIDCRNLCLPQKRVKPPILSSRVTKILAHGLQPV